MTVPKAEKLSVIIPVFNEADTLPLLLDRIEKVVLPDEIKKEIVLVNDCSQDHTEQVILGYQRDHPNIEVKYAKNEINSGKGYSIRKGIALSTGQYVIVQDADLEYDPRDYNRLLMPVLEGFADVVYGSRLMSSAPHRILFFWHSLGNHFLTFLSNLFTNLNLMDMETGYKLFKSDIIKQLKLTENRFGFEPEVTARIAKLPKIRIYEVGISYYGRTYDEGKKINWKDGIRAIYCIIKYNCFVR
jgi:glycosyltransferase involved in cell wall biosynthesis